MRDLKKPAFEQYKREVLRGRRALPLRDVHPIRQRLVDVLESDDRILVQKGSVTHHDREMLDIKLSWMGTEASPQEMLEAIRGLWDDAVFGDGSSVSGHGEYEEERSQLSFVAEVGERHFVTGVVRIQPS